MVTIGSGGIMASSQSKGWIMPGKQVALTLLFVMSFFVPAYSFPGEPQARNLLLFFGDSLNGTIEPCPGCEGGSHLGGLARRGSWVQSVRESCRESLFLDSGDLFFDRYRKAIRAEQFTALSEKAHLILKSYNLLGCAAFGIGDDDLSLGEAFLVDLSRRASFPFISSNLMDKKTGEALFRTHVIKETAGLRIAIFSLLSPHFFSAESDTRARGITLREPIEEARNMIKRISSKADLVILLSHLGYAADIELAETVEGIDVILGSHSNLPLSYPVLVKDTIIVRVGSKGLHTGELHLQLAPNRSPAHGSTLRNAIPLSSSTKEHQDIAEMVRVYKMKHLPEWFKTDGVCAEE
jgi:2',3'-cyclic-nucleotide 2'-phosphodiesterase (5'-nucleotidase family)